MVSYLFSTYVATTTIISTFFPAVQFSDYGNRALGLDLELNKCLKRFSRQGNYDDFDFVRLSSFGQPKNFISCPGNRLTDDGDVLLLSNLISKSLDLAFCVYDSKLLPQRSKIRKVPRFCRS